MADSLDDFMMEMCGWIEYLDVEPDHLTRDWVRAEHNPERAAAFGLERIRDFYNETIAAERTNAQQGYESITIAMRNCERACVALDDLLDYVGNWITETVRDGRRWEFELRGLAREAEDWISDNEPFVWGDIPEPEYGLVPDIDRAWLHDIAVRANAHRYQVEALSNVAHLELVAERHSASPDGQQIASIKPQWISGVLVERITGIKVDTLRVAANRGAIRKRTAGKRRNLWFHFVDVVEYHQHDYPTIRQDLLQAMGQGDSEQSRTNPDTSE